MPLIAYLIQTGAIAMLRLAVEGLAGVRAGSSVLAEALIPALYHSLATSTSFPSALGVSHPADSKTGAPPDAEAGPSTTKWLEEGAPQLCATPKKKLSLYRRGNRRVWYWLKRKPECAQCSFCGAISGRANVFSGIAGNGKCTGQCVQPPQEEAQSNAHEYKQPC